MLHVTGSFRRATPSHVSAFYGREPTMAAKHAPLSRIVEEGAEHPARHHGHTRVVDAARRSIEAPAR